MYAPKGEIGWVAYFDENGCQDFLMTSKAGDRKYFYLYKIENNKAVRLDRATDPRALEEKYIYSKQAEKPHRKRSSATQSKKAAKEAL